MTPRCPYDPICAPTVSAWGLCWRTRPYSIASKPDCPAPPLQAFCATTMPTPSSALHDCGLRHYLSPSNCFLFSCAVLRMYTHSQQESLLERGGVDLVTGPDAYRDLPRLLGLVGAAGRGESAGAVNVQVGEPAHAGFFGFIFLPRLGLGSLASAARVVWVRAGDGRAVLRVVGSASVRLALVLFRAAFVSVYVIVCPTWYLAQNRTKEQTVAPATTPAHLLLPVAFVASPSRPLFPLRARLPTPSPDFLSPTLTDLDLVGVAGRGGAGGCYSCRRTRRTPTSLPSGW